MRKVKLVMSDESRRVSRVDGVLVSRVWSRVSVGMFYRCVSVVVSEWYSMRDCTLREQARS